MSSGLPAQSVLGGGGVGGGAAHTAAAASETAQSKKDLTSWWRNFKRSDRDKQKEVQEIVQAPQGIFGIPLQTSIRYANVAISLFNDEGQSYIYGYVPIVVAKCGVFLKEKATDVEGIFRLSGSEKRIKELKVAFDSPDRYGKGLDWTGYTVHDAANILRRYFNQLPEPIIPLDFYERFREPIRNHQAQAVGAMDAQSPSVGEFDHDAAIVKYQNYITELPPLNRQLLLYILDLLAVFASKSDLNKMTTPNLSAIFQPGILSAPQHDMAPQEYRLSQDVLIFLIENQDSFLIGMQGTAADPETVKEVQSGVPTPTKPTTPTTPNRNKTIIGRTSSNASVGAESIRRSGVLRRNVSVSSKHSKKSDAFTSTPISPGGAHTPTGNSGGMHRSNTVPSKRSGATQSPMFSRDKHSDPPTPSPSTVANTQAVTADKGDSSIQSTPVPPTTERFGSGLAMPKVTSPSAPSSEGTTPLAVSNSDAQSALSRDTATSSSRRDTTPLLAPRSTSQVPHEPRDRNVSSSTTSSRGFLDTFFKPGHGAVETSDRKPNKLQKRRIPGSALSSAQSSSQSLQHELTNESQNQPYYSNNRGGYNYPQTPVSPTSPTTENPSPIEEAYYTPAQSTPIHTLPTNPLAVAGATAPTPQRMPTDATLRPCSPTHSFTSASRTSVTDISDADMVGDDMPPPATPSYHTQRGQSESSSAGGGGAGGSSVGAKEKKRHRWRFSRHERQQNTPGDQSQQKYSERDAPASAGGTGYATALAGSSRSTVGSGSAGNRRSFQEAAAPLSYTDQNNTPTHAPPPPPATSAGFTSTPTTAAGTASDTGVFSDSEREAGGTGGKRGLFSRFRSKIRERGKTTSSASGGEGGGKGSESVESSRGRGESFGEQRREKDREERKIESDMPVRSAGREEQVLSGEQGQHQQQQQLQQPHAVQTSTPTIRETEESTTAAVTTDPSRPSQLAVMVPQTEDQPVSTSPTAETAPSLEPSQRDVSAGLGAGDVVPLPQEPATTGLGGNGTAVERTSGDGEAVGARDDGSVTVATVDSAPPATSLNALPTSAAAGGVGTGVGTGLGATGAAATDLGTAISAPTETNSTVVGSAPTLVAVDEAATVDTGSTAAAAASGVEPVGGAVEGPGSGQGQGQGDGQAELAGMGTGMAPSDADAKATEETAGRGLSETETTAATATEDAAAAPGLDNEVDRGVVAESGPGISTEGPLGEDQPTPKPRT
ncbi:hypothetical protein MBLNU230_g7272t1 [Neophaeotheca triangularis]